tara:strand:+ start:51 stop:161 length:111 start_codon:yes stop_codon:yes gene_type:complete
MLLNKELNMTHSVNWLSGVVVGKEFKGYKKYIVLPF